MDAKLYVERWLLTIKVAAGAAGLEAHVRALDFKGGERLAFEVRKGSEALEIRYRKRRTGARMIAAATGAEVVGRIREVHTRVLAEHRKLLENGFRRFLRRSIRLLEALESALYRDAEFLQRTSMMLRDIPGAAGARPAAVVRRRRTSIGRYEIMPAAALWHAANVRFVGVLERRLVDLSELLPKQKTADAATQTRRQAPERPGAGKESMTPFEEGTELLLVAGDAIDSMLTRRTGSVPIATNEPSSATGLAAEVNQPAGCGEAADLAEGGGIMAEAVTAAGDVGAESVAAGEAAIEIVSSAGTATQALSETGSVVADAACGGVDCGGLDCIPG